MAEAPSGVIDWLMAGDPVIRWQTQRDLLGVPESVWGKERRRTVGEGWGARFLESMNADGSWPVARWTSAVWTLPMLIECGLPADHGPLRRSASLALDAEFRDGRAFDQKWLRTREDLCHLGFWLRIGSYFLGRDERLQSVGRFILEMPLADGGFNCRVRNFPDTHHSAFATTFNVLEGLREAARAGNISSAEFRATEKRAVDFMLEHALYRSDKTGEVIDERFTYLTYPSHWHYTVLRALDYIRDTPEIADPRLKDALELIESRRKPNGRWVTEKRIPGIEHFDMEKWGGESRWNTLRCLRVLKAQSKK
jgi:hypothetical protein